MELDTKKEHEEKAYAEFKRLRVVWNKLFWDDERDFKLQRDMHHSPPSVRKIVDGILEEGIDYINDNLPYPTEEELDDEQEHTNFDRACNALIGLARLIAIRMYQLGNAVGKDLHYENLVECPCQVVTDEELTDFLREASGLSASRDLEGDGWVIKNFDPNKSPELPPHWPWIE